MATSTHSTSFESNLVPFRERLVGDPYEGWDQYLGMEELPAAAPVTLYGQAGGDRVGPGLVERDQLSGTKIGERGHLGQRGESEITHSTQIQRKQLMTKC
jgi:hypothetical protein